MAVVTHERLVWVVLLQLSILLVFCPFHFAVTPNDYQPPGFKEGVNSHFLLFEGEPVNLQVGMVSTGFHSMKVKVTTEAARVSDLENNPFQESDTTEIAHQGLDCDEEEEECNSDVRQSRSAPLLLWLDPAGAFQLPHSSSQCNRPVECAGYKNESKTSPWLESLF